MLKQQFNNKFPTWPKASSNPFTNQCISLMTMVSMLTVDMEDVREKLRVKIRDLPLSQLCDCLQYTPAQGRKDRPPVSVIWFGLEDSVMEMLEPLGKWKDSHLFKKLWKEFGDRAVSSLAQDEKLSFEDVAEHIWIPTERECRRLYRELKSGSITFKELDENFGDFNRDYESMSHEWKTLAIAQDEKYQWIGKTLEKVQQYHILDQYRVGAEVMLQMKAEFSLSGDFEVLEVLAKSVSDSGL